MINWSMKQYQNDLWFTSTWKLNTFIKVRPIKTVSSWLVLCPLLKCLWRGSRFLICKKCTWFLNHFLLRLLITWFFNGPKVKLQLRILDSLVFAVRWLALKRTLNTWFNFDPGRKHFYTGGISDYPLHILLHVCMSGYIIFTQMWLSAKCPLVSLVGTSKDPELSHRSVGEA